MTRLDLLNVLCDFTREVTGDILMPVKMQETDEVAPPPRAAEVHKMRLPDSSASHKVAPYIIHQVITGHDGQYPGNYTHAGAVIRSIFCTYSENESEGALMLLNLIERLRINLLRQGILANRYRLDLEAGLEMFVYPEVEGNSPFYLGEICSTWKIPAIRMETDLRK